MQMADKRLQLQPQTLVSLAIGSRTIPLGTVTSVDPDRGQLGRTAVVRPFVDHDTLDMVALVLLGNEVG